MGKDVELQNKYILFFKLPRNVLQISTLSQQLGLGSELEVWYEDYGHLLIDLTPQTVDLLIYCPETGSVLSKLYLPVGAETKFIDDGRTIRLNTTNISNNFPKTSKTFHPPLLKNFHSNILPRQW